MEGMPERENQPQGHTEEVRRVLSKPGEEHSHGDVVRRRGKAIRRFVSGTLHGDVRLQDLHGLPIRFQAGKRSVIRKPPPCRSNASAPPSTLARSAIFAKPL